MWRGAAAAGGGVPSISCGRVRNRNLSSRSNRSIRKHHLLVAAAALPPQFGNAAPVLAIQVKQAELLIERLSTSLTAERLLDKITTVVTGQTTVEPEIVARQLKAITEGEGYTWEDLRSELLTDASNIWSSSYDLVFNFNPIEFGDWIGGLLGEFAERFAAWELSSLVALGERWLIWTPLVVLPMAWQMSRNNDQKLEDKPTGAVTRTAADEEKHKRVRNELERIKWRTVLVQQVEAKAKLTTIEQSIRQLQQLRSTFPEDESAMDDIGGSWQLVYSSQEPSSLVPQLPGLLEVSQLQQKLDWLQGEDTTKQFLTTQNSALIRFGNVGVIQVGVEGTWEQLTSLVSFDTFTARFVNVLGTSVARDAPGLTVSLPVPLRQSGQWKLMYLDESIRVNQGDSGQLYVFFKSD